MKLYIYGAHSKFDFDREAEEKHETVWNERKKCTWYKF